MKNTAIEWAENTINFYIGCTKVSEGCTNCYMYRLEKRFGKDPTVVRKTNWKTIEKNLKNWPASKIFVNSMSDTFHESIDFGEIRSMFEMMERYPQHQYLILTKRIERAKEYEKDNPFLDNFWLGVSVESGKHLERIDVLLDIRARIHYVSFEPLLGNIPLAPFNTFMLDWAIVGGESGYNPRLPKQEWVDFLIRQLHHYDVPVFYKQFGGSARC